METATKTINKHAVKCSPSSNSGFLDFKVAANVGSTLHINPADEAISDATRIRFSKTSTKASCTKLRKHNITPMIVIRCKTRSTSCKRLNCSFMTSGLSKLKQKMLKSDVSTSTSSKLSTTRV
uniref:Uncharacterized protein n=1 Tax=Glossina brevipalpis TaxID=37001 RepID=A0A1A9WSP6_9MUSC